MVDHSAWRLGLARAYIEPYAEHLPGVDTTRAREIWSLSASESEGR